MANEPNDWLNNKKADVVNRSLFERGGRKVEEVICRWDGSETKLMISLAPMGSTVVDGLKSPIFHENYVDIGANEQDVRTRVLAQFDAYWLTQGGTQTAS